MDYYDYDYDYDYDDDDDDDGDGDDGAVLFAQPSGGRYRMLARKCSSHIIRCLVRLVQILDKRPLLVLTHR